EARIRPGGGLTVTSTAPLMPPVVVTVMICGPRTAGVSIASKGLIWVVVEITETAVMPTGRFSVAPVRNVPVMVTGTLVFCPPDAGVMAVTVGGGGMMVNATGRLVPPGVVTVMFCGPRAE